MKMGTAAPRNDSIKTVLAFHSSTPASTVGRWSIKYQRNVQEIIMRNAPCSCSGLPDQPITPRLRCKVQRNELFIVFPSLLGGIEIN